MHETIKTFMDNFGSLRSQTQARIKVTKDKLAELVNKISNNTLTYDEFKIFHKMKEWNFKNGLGLIRGWTGGYQARDSIELYEEIQKMKLTFEDLKLAYTDIVEALKKTDGLTQVVN